MLGNPLRRIVALLVLVASCLPARAGDRYDPGRAAFETMVNTIILNALRPSYQPPPPMYAPQPYVPGPVTGALLQPAPQPQVRQTPLPREAWRARILDGAARFCDAFPDDKACQTRVVPQ